MCENVEDDDDDDDDDVEDEVEDEDDNAEDEVEDKTNPQTSWQRLEDGVRLLVFWNSEKSIKFHDFGWFWMILDDFGVFKSIQVYLSTCLRITLQV